MRILAIDTSCGAASVAVVDSGQAEPLAVMSRPMARGHAEALAPMVEEAMRGLEGGFASLGAHRGRDRSRLLHRHPRRPRDGAGDGGGARDSGGRRLDVGRLRRAAAQRAPARNHRRRDRRSPRLGLFPVVRGVRPSAGAAALRHAARMRAGDRRGSGMAGGRCGRAYRQRGASRRPALRPRRRAGRARHRRARAHGPRPGPCRRVPARPLYVKPPDARPNAAEPIARAPA